MPIGLSTSRHAPDRVMSRTVQSIAVPCPDAMLPSLSTRCRVDFLVFCIGAPNRKIRGWPYWLSKDNCGPHKYKQKGRAGRAYGLPSVPSGAMSQPKGGILRGSTPASVVAPHRDAEQNDGYSGDYVTGRIGSREAGGHDD